MALRDGKINGLRISTRTIFHDGSSSDSSPAYCYPVILPVQDMTVKKGHKYLVSLSYEMCKGFNNLKYAVSRI
jgi:predicted RNA methylase